MVRLIPSGEYDAMLRNITAENPLIESIIKIQIKRFKNNPNDSRLDTHALSKHLEGRFAFSVTDDIRIVFKWIGKTTVRLLAIGTHTDVY